MLFITTAPSCKVFFACISDISVVMTLSDLLYLSAVFIKFSDLWCSVSSSNFLPFFFGTLVTNSFPGISIVMPWRNLQILFRFLHTAVYHFLDLKGYIVTFYMFYQRKGRWMFVSYVNIAWVLSLGRHFVFGDSLDSESASLLKLSLSLSCFSRIFCLAIFFRIVDDFKSFFLIFS